jgi:hypothetical protein
MTRQIILAAAVFGLAVAPARCRCSANTSYADPIQTESESECPDFVRGAKLAMRDVSGGVELKITTPWTIHLVPLRQLLHQLAIVVEDYTHRSDMPKDDDLVLPPLDIQIRDVSSGALITVKADQMTNVPLLREQAKLLGAFWESSECINGAPGRMANRMRSRL